ncbi:hypothetical protein [Microcella sp.]|uniref:hypothetical protein n=1 Tax=Microcella sp. TaxID=1913979 RepID=UPI00391E0436
MTTPTPSTPAPSPAPERVLRGTLLALLVVPVGTALWVVIWNLGYVAAIVAFLVALGAALLYRLGSGGTVSRLGAAIVTGIVVLTVLVSFYAGMVSDYANFVATELGIGPFDAIAQPLFWSSFHADLPLVIEAYLPDFGLALLFGALGAFSVLRNAFRSAQPATPPAASPAAAEDQPPATAS